MTIAPCPHCGGTCIMTEYPYRHFQVRCDAGGAKSYRGCGYAAPRSESKEQAVQWHNKISQNCGAI